MNFRQLDLNLLRVLAAIHRTGSVTAAGREVPVDLGARYLFQQSCPHVLALLRLLDVPVGRRKASVHFEGMESGLRISLPPRTGRSAYRLLSSARALRYVVHYLRFLLGRRGIFAVGDTASSLDAYALTRRSGERLARAASALAAAAGGSLLVTTSARTPAIT